MEYDREKLSEESISQILQLIEEKVTSKPEKSFLKYNEVDIAEILEDIMDVAGVDKTIILSAPFRKISPWRSFPI